MTGVVPCGLCEGITGAHMPTCPTLVQASAAPPNRPTAPKKCASCGATGYHKPACPLALQARPDGHPGDVRRTPRAVIRKVLQVYKDTGFLGTLDDLTDQIMAELAREQWDFR